MGDVVGLTARYYDLRGKVDQAAVTAEFAGFGQTGTNNAWMLGTVSPDAQYCLNTAELRLPFIIGYIWAFLTGNVFGDERAGSGFFWRTERSHEGLLESTGNDEAELQLRRWRLANDYEVQPEVRQDLLVMLQDDLVGDIRRYLPEISRPLEHQLRNAVETAVSLDRDFQKQVSHYFLKTWPLLMITALGENRITQRFRPTLGMDEYDIPQREWDRSTGTHLALVVWPALIEAGDNTGGNFGAQKIHSRASVVTTRMMEALIALGQRDKELLGHGHGLIVPRVPGLTLAPAPLVPQPLAAPLLAFPLRDPPLLDRGLLGPLLLGRLHQVPNLYKRRRNLEEVVVL
ncbi:hypothetical protein EJ06DRAFT_549761 [Trichodelitschia bisporula]|uniref:Uncharacterized protein n=1 Tax=Trichodelitschia bisporula TaxID=703511 RepID=A0A6G1HSL1_9PEZI|nr:hypothetical protein EJ06DRAFT_549761 [Trichodelitschia bisporula]